MLYRVVEIQIKVIRIGFLQYLGSSLVLYSLVEIQIKVSKVAYLQYIESLKLIKLLVFEVNIKGAVWQGRARTGREFQVLMIGGGKRLSNLCL